VVLGKFIPSAQHDVSKILIFSSAAARSTKGNSNLVLDLCVVELL
jgi:microcompartment protein CcmK/EutM